MTHRDREVPVGPGRSSRRPAHLAWGSAIGLLSSFLVVTGCQPGDPIAEATALLQDQQSEKAVAVLREAVEADPTDPALLHHYGRALIANGQSSLANWPLHRSAKDPEWELRSGLLLAQALMMTNNGLEAIRLLEKILADDPENLQALRLLVDAKIGSQRGEDALEDLDRLIDAFPEELTHQEKKFQLLLDAERFDDAEALITQLREAAEGREDLVEDAEALFCVRETQIVVRRGDIDEAKGRVDACLESHPAARPVLNQALAVYDQLGDEERAMEILRAGIEARPDDLELQYLLSDRLDPEAAGSLLAETAERLDAPGAWLTLRNHQIRHDDMEGALASTDRLLQAIAGVPLADPSFDYAAVPENQIFEAAIIVAISGDYDRARELQSHLEEESFIHLLDARIHFERDELEEALAAWEEAFRHFPSNTGARHLAGIASLRLGQVDRGIEHLRNALRTRDASTDVGIVLAQVYAATGDPHAAVDAIFYHTREMPADVEALRIQQRIASIAGPEAMLQAARNALANADPAMSVAEQAREIELRRGPEVALQFLEEGVTLDLDDPEYVEALAAWVERMIALERAEAAVERVASVAAAHPDDADVLALHGAALSAAGRLAPAREKLERALTLDEDNVQALVALARLDVSEGDLDAALPRFDRAAEIQPRDPSPAYMAAEALIEAGRVEEARERFEALLKERPWEGRAAMRIAQTALEAGDHGDETLRWARRAAAFHGEVGGEAYETLGRVQLARGDSESATASLRRAAAIGIGGPSALYRLGVALAEAGDAEGAITALETALKVEDFPEAGEARAALARLQPAEEG